MGKLFGLCGLGVQIQRYRRELRFSGGEGGGDGSEGVGVIGPGAFRGVLDCTFARWWMRDGMRTLTFLTLRSMEMPPCIVWQNGG